MNRIKDTLQKSGKGITLKNVVKASVAMRRLDKYYETFNRVYKEFFSEPYPVRSVFEVRRLPKRADIEMEVTAYIGNKK